MSPSVCPAPPGLAEWPLEERAFPAVVAGGPRQDKRARNRLEEVDDSADASPSPQLKPAAARPGKVKIALRPLDTGRPEEYDGWRYAAKAEIVGAGLDTEMLVEYVEAIESTAKFTSEHLQKVIVANPELRTLDAKLFSAVLGCMGGARRAAVEERLRAQVPFAAGALALRCLDDLFGKGKESRAHAATRELLNLQPTSRSAEAVDRFLTRYRLLVQQAGDGVGVYARVEVLQRVSQQHPQLAVVWAAWRQAGGGDPEALLRRLEETVAEGMRGTGPRSTDAAWAAVEGEQAQRECGADGGHREWPLGASSAEPGRSSRLAEALEATLAATQQDAAGGSAGGPECWSCGKRGHRSFECREGKKGKGRGKGDASLHSRMEKVERMLETLSAQLGGLQAKK